MEPTKSVRERVHDILETSSLTDPHEIADKLFADLTAQERRAALIETLPHYVREICNGYRRSGPETDSSRPLVEMLKTYQRHDGPIPNPESRLTGSQRWRRASSWFQMPVRGRQQHMRLGEATRDDVLAMVEMRRAHSAGHLAWAAKFETLHDRMVADDVSRVGDLPEAVVEEILR